MLAEPFACRFDSVDRVQLDVSVGFDDDLIWLAEDSVDLMSRPSSTLR